MKPDSLSVAMSRALDAWAVRHPTQASTQAQIEAHAVAHGVSSSGLWRALKRSGLIQPRAERGQA